MWICVFRYVVFHFIWLHMQTTSPLSFFENARCVFKPCCHLNNVYPPPSSPRDTIFCKRVQSIYFSLNLNRRYFYLTVFFNHSFWAHDKVVHVFRKRMQNMIARYKSGHAPEDQSSNAFALRPARKHISRKTWQGQRLVRLPTLEAYNFFSFVFIRSNIFFPQMG